MSMETKEYRSPQKKLLKFFESSRDRWKEKCVVAKQRIRTLQTRVADVHASRERWKEEAKQLRERLAQLEAELEQQKQGRPKAK